MLHPTPGLRLAGLLLAILLGGWMQVRQPQLWPSAVYAGLLLLGLAGAVGGLWAGWLLRPVGVARWLLWCVCWAALAAGSAGWRAELRLAERLPLALEGVELLLVGRVVELPRPSAQGLRLLLEIEQVRDGQGRPVSWAGGRVWLNTGEGGTGSGHDDQAFGEGASPVSTWPQAGERWQLPARLRQPHGRSNPGGLDAEGWMFEQGIVAVGSVRSLTSATVGAARRLAGPQLWEPHALLEAWRQRLRDRILLLLGADLASAGVLAALAVGDQSAIPPAIWDVLRDTGVAHLASISGLHITLFAWLVTAGLRRVWPWLPASWLRRLHWPAPLLARWGGWVLALLYALLSGWGVPAQRTVWMLGVGTVLLSLGRRWPGWLVCCTSGAAVLLVDPWAVEQAGFWLSFVAVSLLMLSDPPEAALASGEQPSEPRTTLIHSLAQGLRSQWVASVGLAPLTLLLFNQVSLVGLLVNLLAVPLVTLVITPLALGGMLLEPLWQLAGWLLPVLLRGLASAAALPWAVWQAPGLAWPWAALPLIGAVWLVLPLGWRRRWPAVLLGLPLAWPGAAAVPQVPAGQFELLAADVGQGSAVLLRTASHSLLFDAGPAWPGGDAGTQTLLPLLRYLGVQRLDALVLSHEDTDHVGGAPALLARLPVDVLLGSMPPQHRLWQEGSQVRRRQPCRAGQSWQWDGVAFLFLHPDEPRVPGEVVGTSSNARSCVLKVTDSQGRSALLTGDIGLAEEQALLQKDAAALRAEVLVVPHHGSRSSSGQGFLEAVQPQWALVQVGYRSRFGHPHQEVLARYERLGIKLVRTDQAGALRWHDSTLECTRVVERRVWHWGGAPLLC